MKTDIKSLLEFAGVDTSKGKAKQLVEMEMHPDHDRVMFTVEVLDPKEGEPDELFLHAAATHDNIDNVSEVEDFVVAKPFQLNGQHYGVGDRFDPMDFQGYIDPRFEEDPHDFVMNQPGGGNEQWAQKASDDQSEREAYADDRGQRMRDDRYEDR